MESYIDYRFEYKFSSYLGEIEEERYVKNIFVDIIRGEHIIQDGNKKLSEKIVGNAQITIFMVSQAEEAGFTKYDIFDTSINYCWIFDLLFDIDTMEYKESILKQYGYDIDILQNVLLFERIEIKPEYRGLGLCAKLTKDVYNFFSSGCGFMILQPFPLQYEYKSVSSKDQQEANDGPTEDQQRATIKERKKERKQFDKDVKKLVKFYESMGFEMIKYLKGSRKLMCISSVCRSEKMDDINLDAYDIYEE